ncbi:MAG: molybdopterin-dependent oxidoreductase [Aestuariivita sp.]|nr:molybdopterin-dependent oxidoreductase [Aestuariivita sp.]MCY4347236.1 molybdopterin-dependent oxidoreductase [Aestuariivita sp.]
MTNAVPTTLAFKLNGKAVTANPEPTVRLSDILRDQFRVLDVKIGCNAGDCGACTVLSDGRPICSCLATAYQAQDRCIETVAYLTQRDAVAKRIAKSFHDCGAAQCGICTPGMIVAATALFRENSRPNMKEIETALGGVLCRCTGYRKIIDALNQGPFDSVRDGKIGMSYWRVDGIDKVTGTELFGDDFASSDLLEVRVIRSPFHHADFVFGDFDPLRKQVGIIDILTAADVPRNSFGVIPGYFDQPVFATQSARFLGEAVAAIIGTRDAIRNLREDDFPVSWTERQSVLEVTDAMDATGEAIHPQMRNNELCSGFVQCGDAQIALENSNAVVEGEFKTAFVEHAYIEPEAGMAKLENGRLEIYACTQSATMDREAIAHILDWDIDRIRIVPTGIGGGFGSKLDLTVQPYLALATIKTGQPTRMAYTRTESMQSSTKRHSAHIKMQIGATADGKLTGVNFEGNFNTGAYASWGPTVANRVPIHASGPYYVRDYHAVARGIYSHCAPAGAFRGFGVPQCGIAQESLLDELAEQLGFDPLEFRINNALEDGLPTVCGQVFHSGVGIKECLQSLRSSWQEEKEEARDFNAAHRDRKRGIGIASGWYGCGNTSLPNPSIIKAGVRRNGELILHQGAIDIGQGSNTVITQIFAEVLKTSISSIHRIGADTDVTPDAGKTSASRQTFVSGNAAKLCGESLRSKILRQVNASSSATLKFEPNEIIVLDSEETHSIRLSQLAADDDGYVFSAEGTYNPPTKPLDKNGQGEPYAQYGYAAQMAVVEVDLLLATVKPIFIYAAHDVGCAINPSLVEGQVEGGVAQGIGMALMEEFIPGRTDNLHDYLIPTIGDVPPIQTILVEVEDPHGPFGAKGLGEHALIPTAPAILNAVRNATGVQMREVPVTPARLSAALRAVQS